MDMMHTDPLLHTVVSHLLSQEFKAGLRVELMFPNGKSSSHSTQLTESSLRRTLKLYPHSVGHGVAGWEGCQLCHL
jgi:hypothetical protein